MNRTVLHADRQSRACQEARALLGDAIDYIWLHSVGVHGPAVGCLVAVQLRDPHFRNKYVLGLRSDGKWCTTTNDEDWQDHRVFSLHGFDTAKEAYMHFLLTEARP